MSDTPDLDTLARNYLDLWQEHLNTISRDGETMDVLARTVALMNSGAAAFATAAKDYSPDEHSTGASGTSNGEPETSGLSPEPSDPDLAQCLERIAALEQRVADLERKKPGKAKGKSGRKNTQKT
jgi:hypothetical protein